MAQVCPSCGAVVGLESLQCTTCGAELDQGRTILPPRFREGPAAPPPHREEPPPPAPTPAPPVTSAPAPPPAPVPAPEAVRPPKRKVPPPSRPVKPSRPPAPQPDPGPGPAAPVYPAPPSYPAAPVYQAPPGYPVPQPPYGYPGTPPAAAPGAKPGRFRKILIEILGGNVEAAPVAPPAGHFPPAPHPAAVPDRHPPPPAVPGYAPAPPPFAPPPPAPTTPEDDAPMTRALVGADLAKLKVPTHPYTLQILDRAGKWQAWSTIGPNGLKLGRGAGNARFPELNTMATRHLRLVYDGGRLVAEDQESLNGVYLKLSAPLDLRDGTRFRVGGYVLEFRAAEEAPPVEPLRAEDGEEFWSNDLRALAYLDFLRPDGARGLRFPVTNPDRTVLGRESRPSKPVDVALPNDEWVSGQHAQVRREAGRFLLEDLHSRNGTFVRIEGPTPIAANDVLLVGRVVLRVVDTLGN